MIENILIHAEVLKEDEFKKMNFQLYGKIGFYHGVYTKGDQYYLIRMLDRNKEQTRYMILEIYHQNHKKRQEIATYGEKRVFEKDDHSRGSLKGESGSLLKNVGERLQGSLIEGSNPSPDATGYSEVPFIDGDAFDLLSKIREAGI